MQNYFGDDLGIRTALVVVQKQQIDVGLRIQLAASVAAARDHCEFLVELGRAPAMLRVCILEQRAQQIVHRGGHRGRDLAAAGAGEMALGQLGADRFEIGARIDAGGLAGDELCEQCVLPARRGHGDRLGAIRARDEAHRFPTARSALK